MGTVPVQNKTLLQMDYQVGTCMFGVWAPRFPAVGSYNLRQSSNYTYTRVCPCTCIHVHIYP